MPSTGFVSCCSFAAMIATVERTERTRIMTLILLGLRLMMLLVIVRLA